MENSKCIPRHPIDELVIDIGGTQLSKRATQAFHRNLRNKDSQGRYFLPDIFFSDDTGLQLWRQINRLPDYYQTNDEVKLIEQHATELANMIPNNASIIDLGCGYAYIIKGEEMPTSFPDLLTKNC